MKWLVALLFVSCAPATIGPPCTGYCSCAGLNAPVKCPGQWECNPDKLCEYACHSPCLGDGGCESPRATCASDGFCKIGVPLILCN